MPRGAPHKGIALERGRALLACETAIDIGDDKTDEDAFAAGRPGRLLPIRVGRKRGSRARYWSIPDLTWTRFCGRCSGSAPDALNRSVCVDVGRGLHSDPARVRLKADTTRILHRL